MVLLVENDANDVPQIHRVASPSTAAIVDCRLCVMTVASPTATGGNAGRTRPSGLWKLSWPPGLPTIVQLSS